MSLYRAHIFKQRQVGQREEVKLKVFDSEGAAIDLGGSGGLPEGGEIGDVVTNTAPGMGDWAAVQPEVSQFLLSMPTTLTSETVLTIRGRDWDGGFGEFFDTSLFTLQTEDPWDTLIILRAGVYRLVGWGSKMSISDDPLVKPPQFYLTVDGSAVDEIDALMWIPTEYTSDGAVATSLGLTEFALPSFERLIKVEENTELQFGMSTQTIDDVNVSSACNVRVNFQRLGDL